MPTMSHSTEAVDGALLDDEEAPCELLCIFWCGTAGLGGHLLGTDEENILYLKYLVLDVSKRQILYEEEFTIKPPAPPQAGGGSCGSSAASDDGRDAALHVSDMCRRDYQLTEEAVRQRGLPLEEVLHKVDQVLERISEGSQVNQNSNHNHHNTHHPAGAYTGPDSPSHPSNHTPPATAPRRVVLITDGQLHLRQVLHPKTAFHNIDLPTSHNTFFDLRKEFRKCYKSDEVMSIQDMVNSLELTSDTSENVGRRSVANMVNIIFRLASDGHVFVEPEQIFVKLEPGIISKGEEVDNGCVVRARGLPWMSTDTEIARFFRGLNVAKGGVALCLSPQGRRNGEALIRFLTGEHRDMALRRHKHHMGGRYIEVYKATGEDFISVAGGNNNEATQFLSRGNVIIRMRGLPYDCTAKQVVDFFDCGENAVKLLDHEEGVLFVRKPDGRATGDAFVMLAHEDDVTKALTKHRELIGSRYIELFRSTSAEVMNRSMDIRHMDAQQQQQQQPQLPPLIAQLPTLPPLLPQQSVALGARRDCIRLRGLPFEATIENVLDFLGEYAKHIQFHGVHMVYTPSGQPSGEAFIQMTSEHAAYSCALNRHNRFMAGKKHRYVEVFSCSGDDMNYVLQGGSPPTSQSVTSVAAANRSIIPAAGGGMFVWGNAATSAGAPPPPLILPSHAPPSHMQPPSLASIPPPSPTSNYLQPAAAAAAAAAAAGIRPPFSPGLPAGVPHTLLPPPTNGMAMLSHLHSPSMKPSSAQVLLPSPLSTPPRPPSLDVSVSQASHSMLSPLKTSTASAAAAAAAAAAVYPSGMFACYQAPTSSASQSASSGMFIIPQSNAKLATPPTSVAMTPPVQFFQAFPPSAADPNTSKPSSQLHLLPSPYSSAIPPQRRPSSVVVSAAGGVVPPVGGSVTSKRSYEQAFSGDRSGSASGSPAVGAKRLATASSIHSSAAPRPTVIPTFSQSSAHFATQFGAFAAAPQFAAAPGTTFSPGLTAPPMAAPMLHAIYPPPLYHPM